MSRESDEEKAGLPVFFEEDLEELKGLLEPLNTEERFTGAVLCGTSGYVLAATRGWREIEGTEVLGQLISAWEEREPMGATYEHWGESGATLYWTCFRNRLFAVRGCALGLVERAEAAEVLAAIRRALIRVEVKTLTDPQRLQVRGYSWDSDVDILDDMFDPPESSDLGAGSMSD